MTLSKNIVISLIRLSNLGARFVLQIFVTKFLGLNAVGTYGLVLAFASILPVVAGFGLHFRSNREVIHLPRSEALQLLRDRLVAVSAIQLFICTTFALYATYDLNISATLAIKIAILSILEAISFEICLSLISLSESILSNIMIFCRTSLWVPAYCLMCYFDPSLRTVDLLIICWLGGVVSGGAALFFMSRSWPWAQVFQKRINIWRIFSEIPRSISVYISDIGNVALAYSDRLIIGYFLGLSEVGVYTFYWAFANSLQSLTLTSVIQPRLPDMVVAAKQGANFIRSEMISLLQQTIFGIAAFSVILSTGCVAALHFVSNRSLGEHIYILPALLFSTWLRALSDVANAGLYAMGKDKLWIACNIMGAIAQSVLCAICVIRFGFTGLIYSTIAASALNVFIRAFCLHKCEIRPFLT